MTRTSFAHWLALLTLGFLAWCGAAQAGVEIVSGPHAQVTATTAVVRWSTNVECGSRMKFGVAPDVLSRKAETPGVTVDHAVTLDGLQPGTVYYFSVGTARVTLATGELTTQSLRGAAEPKTNPSDAAEALGRGKKGRPQTEAVTAAAKTPPLSKTWGNPASLPDHFARHGADFGARSQEEYARMAWEFLQRAKAEGLPAKYDDSDETLRVWDPKTHTFAAYHRDGRARTFFKPDSRGYFDRQPGKPVKLKP